MRLTRGLHEAIDQLAAEIEGHGSLLDGHIEHNRQLAGLTEGRDQVESVLFLIGGNGASGVQGGEEWGNDFGRTMTAPST